MLDARRECLAGELSHPGQGDLPDFVSGRCGYRSESGYPSRARSGGAERERESYALSIVTELIPRRRERGGNLPAVVSATSGAGIV
jgi:hypothetical protein